MTESSFKHTFPRNLLCFNILIISLICRFSSDPGAHSFMAYLLAGYFRFIGPCIAFQPMSQRFSLVKTPRDAKR